MSILASTDATSAAGSDLPIYWRTHPQPPGRSIVWLAPDENPDQYNIDWRRIDAVYVDEPYNQEIPDDALCNLSAIEAKRTMLRDLATLVRAKAPLARFWVNFRAKDIYLISFGCPLNESYIDVISMDWYGLDFEPDIRNLYQWLYDHRATPHQQLALVPGTFTGGPRNLSGVDQARRLSGYFAYANSTNQHCDLPLGPMGRTALYDGCPVWMVAGWIGGVTPHRDEPNGPAFYPIDNPASAHVFNAWQAQFAQPRVDPARVRQARKAIPLLFND